MLRRLFRWRIFNRHGTHHQVFLRLDNGFFQFDIFSITICTNSYFFIFVAGNIIFVIWALMANNAATLPAVVFSPEQVKFGRAYNTISYRFIWSPILWLMNLVHWTMRKQIMAAHVYFLSSDWLDCHRSLINIKFTLSKRID